MMYVEKTNLSLVEGARYTKQLKNQSALYSAEGALQWRIFSAQLPKQEGWRMGGREWKYFYSTRDLFS